MRFRRCREARRWGSGPARQEVALHPLHIALGNQRGAAGGTLHVLGALGEVVALAGMRALGLAAAGEPDPLLGGAFRLHLGHFAILSRGMTLRGGWACPFSAGK